jgi:glutaredoxin
MTNGYERSGSNMKLGFEKQVDGKEKGEVVLFALSTCGWCAKTKSLLGKLGVKYSYVDMDLLDWNEAELASKIIEEYSDHIAYPTIIINDNDCIIGYDPDKIKELLE